MSTQPKLFSEAAPGRLPGCTCFKPCELSDAWRCAREKQLQGVIACPCSSHRPQATPEAKAPVSGRRFDNSSQQAAYSEVESYFRAGSGAARLLEYISETAGRRVTATELEAVSNSHRFGGMLHEIKKRTAWRWTIEVIGGDTSYTFTKGGGE